MTTVSVFVKIIGILDEELFSETDVGCTAPYILSALYDVPVGVAPLLLKHCIAIFAVAKGWLLFDIGWIVLFLEFQRKKKRSNSVR